MSCQQNYENFQYFYSLLTYPANYNTLLHYCLQGTVTFLRQTPYKSNLLSTYELVTSNCQFTNLPLLSVFCFSLDDRL